MKTAVARHTAQERAYGWAFALAVLTIVYNVAEGLLATLIGFEEESLALFGFGVDSFIEVISGVGIAHMVLRVWRHPDTHRDAFERTALRVTGFAFYALVAGLLATAAYNVYTGHRPESTFWGLVISLVSIAVMWAMIVAKTRVGRQLNSAAILADAECSRVCIFMSVILLVSSGLYEIFRLPYVDAVGTLGLALLAYREGRECFEKAKGKQTCSCGHD